MDEGELETALKESGLTQYQAAAYLALLDLGAAPAAEIAEMSAVPGPRIYDVLRDLESRGYVELYKQGQLHARVRDPSSIIETIENRVDRFERAKVGIRERWERPDIEHYAVSIVKRRATAYERAAEAIAAAETRIKLAVDRSLYERFLDPVRSARARGAHVKVCLWTDPGADIALDREAFEGACTEVRHRDLPSPFVALVDRETVCFAPNTSSTNEYGVIVHDPSHAYVFNVFFQTSLWSDWETVFPPDPDDRPLEFVDIRECVGEVRGLIERGATVRARVHGIDVETGDPVDIEGEIVETGIRSPACRVDVPDASLNGVASLTIETGEKTVTAGGWGAMLEDVEAIRVTVTDVRE